MCYIMAVKNAEDNKELREVLLQVLSQKIATNNDGYAIQTPTKAFKGLDLISGLKLLGKADFSDLLIHFRQATTGQVNHDNIHAWTANGYSFMHNGWVTGVASNGRQQKKADSLIYFEKLVEALGKDRQPDHIASQIKKLCKELNFYGRALLLDRENDRLYAFGDFDVYIVNRKTLILSSTGIDLDKVSHTEYLFGLGFDKETDLELDIKETRIDNIGVFERWSTPTPTYRYLALLEKSYSYPSYSQNSLTGGWNRKPDNDVHDKANLEPNSEIEVDPDTPATAEMIEQAYLEGEIDKHEYYELLADLPEYQAIPEKANA